jgi:DEAD/DEAH box helicase domain-containing protein
LAERLFEMRSSLLAAARDHVRACSCAAGCPSCVGPANEVDGDPKRAALRLLERLLAGGP